MVLEEAFMTAILFALIQFIILPYVLLTTVFAFDKVFRVFMLEHPHALIAAKLWAYGGRVLKGGATYLAACFLPR